MKNAIFRKKYITDTRFDSEDLIQIVNEASNNNYISFSDKNQLESITNNEEVPLIEIFERDRYELEYLGMDDLNSYHLFKISNEVNQIDFIMQKVLFNQYFKIQ